MTLTKERAIAYYHFKKPQSEIKRIRELGVLDKDVNFFIINDNYIIRYIIPEAMNCLMRNQNYKPRISGAKLTKADMLYFLTSNRYYSKGEERTNNQTSE